MPTSRILALEARNDPAGSPRAAFPRIATRLAHSRRTPLTIGALVLATAAGLAAAPAAESTGTGAAAVQPTSR